MKTRASLIKLIHIHKGKLDWGDEYYRDYLVSITGKDSCKKMGDGELTQVEAAMRLLVPLYSVSPATKGKANKTPLDKLRAMWIDCYKAGCIPNGSEEALRGWVKRQTGVDNPEWLTVRKMRNCIEALKKIRARTQSQTALQPLEEESSSQALPPVPPIAES